MDVDRGKSRKLRPDLVWWAILWVTGSRYRWIKILGARMGGLSSGVAAASFPLIDVLWIGIVNATFFEATELKQARTNRSEI